MVPLVHFPHKTLQALFISLLLIPHLATLANAETVIPLFIFAGQSNMVGYATNIDDLEPPQLETQNNVLFYGSTDVGAAWSSLTPPTQVTRTISGRSFGPEFSAGRTISTALGNSLVAEVKYAQNGSTVDSFLAPGYTTTWDPGTQSNLFDGMVDHATAAKNSLQALHPDATIEYAGFFWMQGESDAQFQSSADDYEQNLVNFISAVRAQFGNDMPFIIGQIRSTLPYSSTVRTAETNVTASLPKTFLVFTDDLPLYSDGIHFNSEATYILGERMAQSYLAAVPEPSSLALVAVASTMLTACARRSREKASPIRGIL